MEPVSDETHERVVKTVGEGERSSTAASGAAIAITNGCKKLFRGICAPHFRKGRSGKLSAVVIRATDENLSPWLRVCWRKIMAICEHLDLGRRQLTEKSLGEIAQKSVAQTVDSLKMLEKED